MKNFALIGLALATLTWAGCGGDKTSKLWESCDTSSDCGSGLVCLTFGPAVSICMEENLPLDPTANICVDCASDADCDGTGEVCDNGSCDFHCTSDQACVDYAGAYTSACELSTGDCYSYGCASDADCGGGRCDLSVGEIALQGVCFDCDTAADCSMGETCLDRDCVDSCASDADCDGFMGCNATTSVCEWVGCKTDRECALDGGDLTGPYLVCNQDTKFCELPCDSDAECLFLTEGDAAYCIDGACADLGCTNNDECRVESGPNSSCVDPSTIDRTPTR